MWRIFIGHLRSLPYFSSFGAGSNSQYPRMRLVLELYFTFIYKYRIDQPLSKARSIPYLRQVLLSSLAQIISG